MMGYNGEERRNHPPVCLHEHEWGVIESHIKNQEALWEAHIKNQESMWNRIEQVVLKHIDEGERSGGVRDRLLIVEQAMTAQKKEISVIKQGYWKVGLACGFLGALLGNITPEAFRLIATWLVGKG